LRISIELVKLIDSAISIFMRFVMLDKHHRNIIAFLRIGHINDRFGAGLQTHRAEQGRPPFAAMRDPVLPLPSGGSAPDCPGNSIRFYADLTKLSGCDRYISAKE
jgi:hypothetical protein